MTEPFHLACSIGYGYTVDKTIIYAYLPQSLGKQNDFELELFGERKPIRLVNGPLYDPDNERLKA